MSGPAGAAAGPCVLCFGEALVDRLEGGGLPAEEHWGGAPANAACALARLGTPVAFLGRVGADPAGGDLAAVLRQRGVELSGLQWDPQRPTRVVRVRRQAGGERSFGGFVGDRGVGFADQAVERQPLLAAAAPLLKGARWLLVGTLAMASPAAAAAQDALVAAAAAAGVAVAVDLNWRPSFWGLPAEAPPSPQARQAIAGLLAHADLIKAAAEEAAWWFGAAAEPAAISAALPRRPAVLISDGPRPVRWWLGASGVQPAFGVPVVDTTGAGDAFVAGLLHCLCTSPRGGSADPWASSSSSFSSSASSSFSSSFAASASSSSLSSSSAAAAVAFAAACGALTCAGAGAIEPQPSAAQVAALLGDSAAGPA